MPYPSLPAYARAIILGHCDELNAQIPLIDLSRSIEHLHRARVSARRLRNSLWLFQELFTGTSYAWARKKLRKLTRSLGEARDLDTQISCMTAYGRTACPAPRKKKTAILLGGLRRARKECQSTVRRALKEFPAKLLRRRLEKALEKSHSSRSLFNLCRARINKRISLLLEAARTSNNPCDETGLHRMRIAAKNLRYTLEHISHLFGTALYPYILEAKTLQDTLGDMRNYTIWKKRIVSGDSDLTRLCDIEASRAYQAYRRAWQRQTARGIWKELPRIVENKKSFLEEDRKKDILASCRQVGAYYLFEEKHSRQVTRLSLSLFDCCRRLHSLGSHERLLLEAAAVLHDVGTYFGLKRHHKSSRDIIISSPLLASLSDEERLIVALTARYHRRAIPDIGHRDYASLGKRDRTVVNRLASLLRLADGLDRSHAAAVTAVRCRLSENKVHLSLRGKGMLRNELIFGKKKADLFERVFGKEVVCGKSVAGRCY
jgi:exopolyphosphatase/guanosine-5'-triphosphate,3'-diphosphate pyrophosphatase